MGTFLRFLLLRFLPRRIVPIVAAWDIYQLYRGRRRSPSSRSGVAPLPATRRRKPLW